MSLIPPLIVLTVGAAMLVLVYHGGKKVLPELDDALERVKDSPDGMVDNVPRTVYFIVGMVVGLAVVTIGLLWLAAALVIALVA